MLNSNQIRRGVLGLPIALTVTAGLSIGAGFFGTTQVPTTINDFFGPGTQPNTLIDQIVPSVNCTSCHAYFDFESEPYRRWVTSLMGQAGRDPIFYACLSIANQDAAEAGELCLRCHTPGAWLAGRSVPADGSGLDPMQGDLDGVTCHLCHRMVDPVADPANPAVDAGILAGLGQIPTDPHSGQYVIDPNDRRRGPFDLGPGFFWHAWEQSPFHQESKLCATCHDVSNPVYVRSGNDYVLDTLNAPHPTGDKFDQFPIERTYSEWTMSDFAQREIEMNGLFGGNKTAVATCQDCHMPDTTGVACAPGLGGAMRTDLPQHNFNGANNWVLNAVRSLHPDSETGLAASLVAGHEVRTVDMLSSAADLEAFEREGKLHVRVENRSGHKLPTGYGEGRRIWLNVQFFDAGNAIIAEHGAYDDMTADLTTNDTKVYEVKHGIDAAVAGVTGLPVGESLHFALNNTIEKDNRIPPRGFKNSNFVAIQAEPVGATYREEQFWDDTEYDIPVGAVKALVFLNHQLTSKEYIEFLRDENTTDMNGQIAYDQWVLHGKSTPTCMQRRLITFSDQNCATPVQYGLAKITTLGDTPVLSAQNTPSVAGGMLTLRVDNAIPNSFGVLLWSNDSASFPFQGGKRYVSNPFTRAGNFPINANGVGVVQFPLVPGMEDTDLFFQVVFRDTVDATGWGLTNGLAVVPCD